MAKSNSLRRVLQALPTCKADVIQVPHPNSLKHGEINGPSKIWGFRIVKGPLTTLDPQIVGSPYNKDPYKCTPKSDCLSVL